MFKELKAMELYNLKKSDPEAYKRYIDAFKQQPEQKRARRERAEYVEQEKRRIYDEGISPTVKKTITLKKIPKVPKVPTKKMIKSDKVLKELDELMKDVDNIIANHSKSTKTTKPTKTTESSTKKTKTKTYYVKLINKIDKESMTNFWVLCNMKKFEPMTNIKKNEIISYLKKSPDTWNKLIANINLIHNIKTKNYDNASNDKEIFTISINVYQINDNGNIDTNASDSWKLVVNYTKGEFEDKLPTHTKTITNVKNMLKLVEKKKIVSDMIGLTYTEFIDAFNKLKAKKQSVVKDSNNENPKPKPKPKPKLMTKKAEKDIIKMVNNEIREVKKIVKEHNPKPKTAKPKLTEEEKLANREAKKEATRLRNIEKKANEKRIKAEAKAKLEAHKKEVQAEKEKIERAKVRKSKEIDELKSDFTMFRRYVKYLPTPEEARSLEGKKLQSAKDYADEARQYYKNAVDTYKRYKNEGLIEKAELDKLIELFEVKHYLNVLNEVSNILE